MLKPVEAYEIAKRQYNYPKLVSSLEFDNFYLFSFAPLLEDTEKGYLTGTEFDAVDKRTGRLFKYDITSNVDAFLNAKEIKIETFMDKVV